jgi:fermentation-respiration switch protein FrsA (DUF1100 family)
VTGPLPLIEAIGKIAPRPILLIAGAQSEHEKDMQRKFLQAAGEGCTLWEVPEAGHTESWTIRNDEYKRRMIDFFDPALL